MKNTSLINKSNLNHTLLLPLYNLRLFWSLTGLMVFLSFTPKDLSAQCVGGIIASGNVTDGSGDYSNNESWTSLIQPSVPFEYIKLSFTQFALEGCCDYVRVYDGPNTSAPLLLQANGTSIPADIITTSPSVLVRFTSDYSVTRAGFNVNWTAVNSCTEQTLSFFGPSGGFDDGSGTAQYSDYYDRSWLIKPNGAEFVTISFTSFDLDASDELRVYDGLDNTGLLLGTFTGSTLPYDVSSSGNSLYLELETDAFATSAQGFELTYTSESLSSAGGGQWSEDNDNIYFQTGNVGIGTSTPSAMLEVNGTIRSEEVRVEAVNAPDYVFEEDYDLRSLEEIKEYIEEFGHLPEVPSAVELEEKGMGVSEMNLLLLKKIEELTLYLLEAKGENMQLKYRIEQLESRIK